MAEPTTGRAVRIVIADDHPIFRDGLRRLLGSEPGFTVVGQGRDGNEAVALVEQLRPDVLLLDVSMPGVTGLAALERLSTSKASVRTVLLTAAISRSDMATALQLGARGVVLKDVATEILFKCIRHVMEGHYWLGREAVADLVRTLRELSAGEGEGDKPAFGLTRREREILAEVVAGGQNRDIARKLTISEDTVKHHLSNIFDKVGVSTRLELALFAVHHKLVDH